VILNWKELDASLKQRDAQIAHFEAKLEVYLGEHARLIERFLELEGRVGETERRLNVLESWAAEPSAPFPHAGSRLAALEAKVELDQRALITAVVDQIRKDPQLRELLRGPRGIPGLDGDKGPPGDAGQTVLREVRISG